METAAQRKARLQALRKNLTEPAPEKATSESSKLEPLKLSFRNYDPLSDHLKEFKKDAVEGETLEKQAAEFQKDIPTDHIPATEPLELQNLAPMKPGFDLARDLEKRAERLEKETNYCISELIRERLKSQKDLHHTGENAGADYDDLEEE
ncbi:Coiled-coil domain-containing protein 12 [Phlyctochytrium planicorne]|nr:Coiled-coil domain-containing protein 12 [Phlyctochytrium planicorne]